MANYCTPQVQAKINNLYNLKQYTPTLGMTDLAFSETNGAGIQAQMINQDGKMSRWAITYPSSLCNAVVDCSSITCTDAPTAVSSMTSCDYFESFDCKSTQRWKVTEAQLRDLGALDVKDVFSHQIWDQMQKLKGALNTASIVALCAAAGTIDGTIDTRTLKLVDPTTGAPRWSVDTDILRDFSDAGFNNVPLLIGNRQMDKYVKAVNRGGLNAQGLHLDQIERFPAFYDPNMVTANCAPTTNGNDTMLAVLPGLFNLITWSENAGMFATRAGQVDWSNVDPQSLLTSVAGMYEKSVIQDPATGMLFDFNIVYDPSCGFFKWWLSVNYRIKILSLTGCKHDDFTGVIKYDVCPAVEETCANPS